LEEVRKLTFGIRSASGGVNEEKRGLILEIVKELQDFVKV